MKLKIDELLEGIHDDQIIMVAIDLVSINHIKELTLYRINSAEPTNVPYRKRTFSLGFLAAILTTFLVAAAAVDALHNYYFRTTEIEYPISIGGQILPLDPPSWGIEFSTANITTTGMELTCFHSHGDYTGQLIVEHYYYIEVKTASGWNAVSRINADSERKWHGTILSENEIHTWVLDWSNIYSELPPGSYRLRQPVWELNNRSIGQYYEYCIEFTVIGGDK